MHVILYNSIARADAVGWDARGKWGSVPPVSASAFSPLHETEIVIFLHLTAHPIASGNQFIWNFHLQAERLLNQSSPMRSSQSYLILFSFTVRKDINAMQWTWTKCQDWTDSYAWRLFIWSRAILSFLNKWQW